MSYIVWPLQEKARILALTRCPPGSPDEVRILCESPNSIQHEYDEKWLLKDVKYLKEICISQMFSVRYVMGLQPGMHLLAISTRIFV
jgi:hypothetical protein